MSTKLKLIFVVLIIGTLFLTWRGIFGVASIFNFSNGTAFISKTATSSSIITDSDHDGLSDSEETFVHTDSNNPDTDGDGFLDGEEVMAGTDPLINDTEILGPIRDNDNLTISLAKKLAAGYLAGDLNSLSATKETLSKGLKTASLATLIEYHEPVIKSVPPAITSSDSDADMVRYLNEIISVGELIPEQLKTLDSIQKLLQTEDPKDRAKAMAKIRMMAYLFDRLPKYLDTVAVPPQAAAFHSGFVLSLRKIGSAYVSLWQLDSDPLLSLIALESLTKSLVELQNQVKVFNDLARQYGITVP